MTILLDVEEYYEPNHHNSVPKANLPLKISLCTIAYKDLLQYRHFDTSKLKIHALGILSYDIKVFS